MRPRKTAARGQTAPGALIAEITTDAHGEGEQFGAFQQALADNVPLPAQGFVIGEPVTVLGFSFDGNERRGLTAKCRGADGRAHVVAAADVTMAPDSEGALYLAAYREWMGLAPETTKPRATRTRTVAPGATDEFVILAVGRRIAHCRAVGGEEITMPAKDLRGAAPGEIVKVRSGAIQSVRIDVGALRLAPLKLAHQGPWDPAQEYWGEDGDPIAAWAKPIIARGPRPAFEMEQVTPGFDPADPNPDSDAIGRAIDLREAGDRAGARAILMDLCRADLRCLDAHANLGHLLFDRRPVEAIRHYEVGFRIGEWSLGDGFDGVLPWGWIDNRPFLRMMHGLGLCLWRLRKFKEAGAIFKRMLWLNPTDNQGIRFLIDDVRAKVAWQDRSEW